MAIKVPIRIRGDKSKTGLEAERVFNIEDMYLDNQKLQNAVKLIISRSLENKEISYFDWLLLKHISSAPEDITVSELSHHFDINMPQATTIIKQLNKKNLVRYRVSKIDRRVKYIKCTRKGNKLVFESEESIQHAMRYWLFDLNDSELNNFIAITRKISNFEIPPIEFS